MHFSGKVFFSQSGEENMIEVDGQDLQEAGGAGSVDGVAGVVHRCPGVCSRSQASIRQQVQHLEEANLMRKCTMTLSNLFIRIVLTAHEDEVL